MILTCPTCATRYFVGEDAVPAQGRVVRCASCGGSWRALPSGAEPAPLQLEPAPAAAEPAAGFGRADAAAPVSRTFREQVRERRRTHRAMAAGVVWAGAGAGAVVLALCAVLFRQQLVELAPRTAGVYAALGLAVNPTGLALEAEGQPGLSDGRAVTVVSGVERNVAARPRAPSAVRVTFLDKAGRALAAQVAQVAPGAIAPGEVRPFRAVFVDPPLSAASFQVEFAFDAPALSAPVRPRGGAHAVVAPAIAPTPAPEPARIGTVTEAKPLPADSPYALPAVAPHG